MKYFILKGKGGVIFSFVNKVFSEKDICGTISNCPASRNFCYYYSGCVPYFRYPERVAKHLILIKLRIFIFKMNCLIEIF